MRIFFIVFFLILSTILKGQELSVRAWEPEKPKINNTYNTLNNTLINIYIRENRKSNKEYSEILKRYIATNIEESFPKTKIQIVKKIVDLHSTQKNSIFLLIKIDDYFVSLRHNKWIGKTSFNITILDFGSKNTKKYNKIISHISTKPNRRGLQASKEALLQSFNKANKKLINYIYNCDSGIEKFEILN